ncbi:MAG: hypothetical protein IPK21_21030 [Haliscomenobacter sp.]|nr:hypothetical protein [Haliscomenobacter sp.]
MTKEMRVNRANRWKDQGKELLIYLINIYRGEIINRGFWELLEFDGNLPFVGNKLAGKTGIVRTAPLLPGESTRDVYYTEVMEGTSPYNQLSVAFDRICELSIPINEYILYGGCKEENFQFKGILKRSFLDEFLNATKGLDYCFPVVLVVLHNSCCDKNYSLLQKEQN